MGQTEGTVIYIHLLETEQYQRERRADFGLAKTKGL